MTNGTYGIRGYWVRFPMTLPLEPMIGVYESAAFIGIAWCIHAPSGSCNRMSQKAEKSGNAAYRYHMHLPSIVRSGLFLDIVAPGLLKYRVSPGENP